MKLKRLRIFAGPNGSGKSVLYNYLIKAGYFNQYPYVNADIFTDNLLLGKCEFSDWPIKICGDEFATFVDDSRRPLGNLSKEGLINNLEVNENIFHWHGDKNRDLLNIVAAHIADYVNKKMLDAGSSYFYETVLSHPSKLEFIKTAKEKGFKIYLYFITTQNPQINISRINLRVSLGGHNVDQQKVIERYARSMDILYDAVKLSNRAYLFDNSTSLSDGTYTNFAEVENGQIFINNDIVPHWFNKYILNKGS